MRLGRPNDNLEISCRVLAPKWAYRYMTNHAVPSAPTSGPASSPAFLTVEEAASVLRIGRTAAYLLARRWRDTDGAEGLPVVRFGRLLRVPVHELERLAVGAIDLTEPLVTQPAQPPPPSTPDSGTTNRRHRRKADEAQASLFPEAS